jgi:hypothetical protein
MVTCRAFHKSVSLRSAQAPITYIICKPEYLGYGVKPYHELWGNAVLRKRIYPRNIFHSIVLNLISAVHTKSQYAGYRARNHQFLVRMNNANRNPAWVR